MPKKIIFESAVHQFLWAARRLRERIAQEDAAEGERLGAWINLLVIDYRAAGELRVAWKLPVAGERVIAFRGARFYTRGDARPHEERQRAAGLLFGADTVMTQNAVFFDGELREVLLAAGVLGPKRIDAAFPWRIDAERKNAEEAFHDQWAASVDVTKIDVRKMNEACTAPEMRQIIRTLGDIRGLRVLDVGCGLGEASVYFALQGAEVTATDISPGMCDVVRRLGEANGVKLCTHVSAAEDLGLPATELFDVIYTGNTLHHVDIAVTLPMLARHLKPDGRFVSWDPVAYNPVINIYRRWAMQVRTVDEHPLTLRDIATIRSHFRQSEVNWFWFSTLLIFVVMAIVQRRDPNKERYWKVVIDEADRWAWLYRPLEALDRLILLLPFLRKYCWNVVIVGKGPCLPEMDSPKVR